MVTDFQKISTITEFKTNNYEKDILFYRFVTNDNYWTNSDRKLY